MRLWIPSPCTASGSGDNWDEKEGTIVGWGASKADSADITQVEGSGIERSGQALLEGSPTLADYHADDPNPGLLDPAIRADLLKLNGSAPYANICAGDSGGPLIVKHPAGWGWNDWDACEDDDRGKLAGVIMWTGLWCKDYSIVTRIDPFLPFLDNSIQLGGKMPVTPELNCVAPLSDGSFNAYFGYTNGNAVTITIPDGPKNYFPKDLTNHGRRCSTPEASPTPSACPSRRAKSWSTSSTHPPGPRRRFGSTPNRRRAPPTTSTWAALMPARPRWSPRAILPRTTGRLANASPSVSKPTPWAARRCTTPTTSVRPRSTPPILTSGCVWAPALPQCPRAARTSGTPSALAPDGAEGASEPKPAVA